MISRTHSDEGDLQYTVFLTTGRGEMPLNVCATSEKQIRVTNASVGKEEAEKISYLFVGC